MEVMFMDNMFSTTKIIDAFTSCIWNIAYNGYGDFELYFPMDYTSLTGIEIGGYASIRESDRYMIVESIDVQTSITDGNYLIIAGRSLESLLERRIIREKTILTGNLQDCIMRILNTNAIYPSNTNRMLTGLSFKRSIDPKITALSLDFELEAGDNLYDAVYTICDAYKIGFRILPLTNGQMEFELYAGMDHSYNQEINPWIIFSPKFENLKESEMIVDTSTLKNACSCDATIKRQVVNDDGTVDETDDIITIEINNDLFGLNRREIYLNKSSLNVESVSIDDYGKASDRVNVGDYMEWVVKGFDRKAYEAAMKKYTDTYANRHATIEKDRTEWKMVQHLPEWQESHPNENPFYWVQVEIKGDSPDAIRRKNAYNAAIAARAPKKSDFYIWGWELTDLIGYNKAIAAAQAQINAEFEAAVSDKIGAATNSLTNECNAKLAENSSITKFVGDVDANVNYKFGVDYNIGDIVQIVNEYDFQATTRIISIIIGQDTSSGFIIRPTFKSDDEAVFTV